MWVNTEKKFIVLLPPKTASHSIRAWLYNNDPDGSYVRPHVDSDERLVCCTFTTDYQDLPWPIRNVGDPTTQLDDNDWNMFYQHLPAEWCRRILACRSIVWSDYDVIMLCRNPWQWALSCYQFCRSSLPFPEWCRQRGNDRRGGDLGYHWMAWNHRQFANDAYGQCLATTLLRLERPNDFVRHMRQYLGADLPDLPFVNVGKRASQSSMGIRDTFDDEPALRHLIGGFSPLSYRYDHVPPSVVQNRQRVALCFTTYDNLNQPEAWNSWWDPSFVSVYAHAKFPNRVTGWLRDCLIDERCDTKWGNVGVVRARIAMLRESLRDPTNQRFVMMTNSDLAVQPCPEFYEWAMAQQNCIRTIGGDVDTDIGQRRFQQLTDGHGFEPEQWLKSFPIGMMLNRTMAQWAVDCADDMIPRFENVDNADEYYFSNVLRPQVNDADHVVTLDYWTARRRLSTDDLRSVFQKHGTAAYGDITEGVPCLVQLCHELQCSFIRKVEKK